MKTILEDKGLCCTGCAACFNACPVNAIDMKEDIYGFLYPHINDERCIKCNRCQNVCPVLKTEPDLLPKKIPACYAVMASDDVRYYSSSGGAFFVLAEQILSAGGNVCGAAWENNLHLQHIMIQKKGDLNQLQKSKYVQSEIGTIYREIKEELESDKDVLFSGCPCQIVGLKAFLGKNYDHLITVSTLCHGVPSQKMLKDSLKSISTEGKIDTVDFRDKSLGWDSVHLKVEYDDHLTRTLSLDESYYEQGFHYNLTLRPSCYDCKFCEIPHESDITIGDFWGIENYRPDLNDKKGTSVVLINTPKGEQLFKTVASHLKAVEKMPLDAIKTNRIHSKTDMHPNRNYFLYLYPNHEFNQAVLYALQNKFDVGLVGNWSYPNYGSELTYFALYFLLKSWNLSVRIISWPRSSKWQPYDRPQLFSRNPYPEYAIAPLVNNRRDLKRYNNDCNTFILGSDQLLNNNLYNWFDKFMQLDWVQNNKKKIAYATSFGTDFIWGSDNDRAELSYFLQQFDAVSVREKSAVELAEEYYHVKASLVLDPVFLVKDSVYRKLIQEGSNKCRENDSLFVYILNPTKEKSDAFRFAAKQLKLSIHAAGDGAVEDQKDQDLWGIKTTFGLSVEQWLSHIDNSQFVITDSFHGTCFAIIFRKPFISICNSDRGATRFTSLLGMLGLENRLIKNETELLTRTDLLQEKIDYDNVYKILSEELLNSKQWLHDAIFMKKSVHKPFSSYDILDREIDTIYAQMYQQKIASEKHTSDLKNHVDEYKNIFSKYRDDCNLKLGSIQDELMESNKNLLLHKENMNFLSKNLNEIQSQFRDENKELRKNIETLNQQYHNDIEKINQQYLSILNSKSFKIGRWITWIPRKILETINKLKNKRR